MKVIDEICEWSNPLNEFSGILKRYLEENIYPKLGEKPFSVVYVHTDVQRSENFPGFSLLRSIYDAILMNVKNNLKSVYFLHPDLQAMLFLATFGRLFFNGGERLDLSGRLYSKLRYVSRLEFLCISFNGRKKEGE
ncbi:hypothetical protein GQ457_02G037740 [Hibiscus cannabinus]